MSALTPREREVLAWAADGWTQGEASVRMSISQATVRHHTESIYLRLRARNVVHAVALMDDSEPGWRSPARPVDIPAGALALSTERDTEAGRA